MPNEIIFNITLNEHDMEYVIRSVGSCARAFEEAANNEENPESVRDELYDLAAELNALEFNLQLQRAFGAVSPESEETDEG